MLRQVTTLLGLLLAIGLIGAGCGGDDDQEAATDRSTPTADKSTQPTREEAVSNCVEGVGRYQVPEQRKEELRGLCRALGSDDEDEVRAAAEEYCGDLFPVGTPKRESLIEDCAKGAGFRDP